MILGEILDRINELREDYAEWFVDEIISFINSQQGEIERLKKELKEKESNK